MEWDRRHSAFLYHLLSGGQPVHRDKLHYELLASRAKTSPKLDSHQPRQRTQHTLPQKRKNGVESSSSSSTDKTGGEEEDSSKSPLTTIIEQQLPSPRTMALREQELEKDVKQFASAATAASSASSKAAMERRQEAKLLFIKLCWEVVAWSNEGWVWVALSPFFLLLSFFYLDPLTIAKVKYLYIMLLVDILLTGGIKYATKRTRPAYNKGGLFVGPDIFSFPSGHSSRAMLLLHVSIYVFGWQSLWSNIAVMCWAVLVAISRLALGRHFLTDVMGGLTLGALEFWATFFVLQRFMFLE